MEFSKLQTFLKYLLIAFIIIFFFHFSSKSNTNQESLSVSKVITLTNWQYLAGKLSDSSEAQNITIHNVHSSNSWKTISSLKQIKQNYKGEIIWLRTTLPDLHFYDPVIYFGEVNYSIQAYLNNTLIYQWGSFTSPFNKDISWNQVLISLFNYQKGDEIVFRIRLGNEFIGFNEKTLYGSSLEIMKGIFIDNITNFIFIVVSFFTGLIILFVYIYLARSKLLLGIIFFLVPAGIFIFTNTLCFQLIFNLPAVFYHLNHLSLLAATIAFYYIIEQVVVDKYKKIINILWKIRIAFIPVLMIIDISQSIVFYEIMKYMVLIDTLYAIIGLSALFFSALDNKYEYKIFISGIVLLYVSLIIEFIIFINSGSGYGYKPLQIGMLLFVASIIWVAIHNHLETNREKELANKRELEVVKQEHAERYQFVAKLIDSQEFERNRIALELHDSVGQKLLIIKNQLLSKIKNSPDNSSNGSLQMLSNLAGETIEEIREISYNLRPQNLDQLGLTAAIKTIVENISESSDIKFSLNIDNIDKLLPKPDEINLFRIIQESLNNIVKHSEATEASVNITRNEDALLIEINDNGIGMAQNNSAKRNLGFRGMKERAAIIGAKIDIDMQENSGTFIKLEYKKGNIG